MASMIRASSLLALLATLAACDRLPVVRPPTDPGPGPATGVITAIRFGKHYGFCAGYCLTDLRLFPTGKGAVVHGSGPRQPTQPEMQYDVALSPAEQEKIFAEARTAIGPAWQPRYGCPDCADQGAWPLEVDVDGKPARATVLDPQQVPAFLKALTDLLNGVVSAHPRVRGIASCPAGVTPAIAAVDKLTLVNDEAQLAVTFGGGCEAHAFDLCWDGAFLESFPVQARLTLVHTRGADDACKALVQRHLSFNLESLREAYRRGYPGTGPATISLSIVDSGRGALRTF
jgi:hypothetical protein